MWKTPENLYPSLNSTQLNIGLNGELVEWPVAEERGYMVNKYNSTFEIGIPYNAEGGHRKVRRHFMYSWLSKIRFAV